MGDGPAWPWLQCGSGWNAGKEPFITPATLPAAAAASPQPLLR
eukprot:COSAG01_NODE_783_length_13630_cov_5.556459_23_plen_43_part_00